MAEAATWDVYVMEYARSKNQPWVDLISGMYHEGVMDLPFSFIFAQRDEDRVLIDTGFMQDDHRSTFSRKFGIPTWISPLRMLAEIGVHADAINAIFLTHAGWVRGCSSVDAVEQDPSIVDEDVQPPVHGLDHCEGGFAVGLVRYIELEGRCLESSVAQACGGLLGLGRVARRRDHVRSALCELAADLQAKTASAPGHECDPVEQGRLGYDGVVSHAYIP